MDTRTPEQRRRIMQAVKSKNTGPELTAQFMDDRVVALFELTLRDEEIKIVEERHYRLVPVDELDREAIRDYRS